MSKDQFISRMPFLRPLKHLSKLFTVMVFGLLLSQGSVAGVPQLDTDSLLVELDKVVDQRSSYDQFKENRLAGLKQWLALHVQDHQEQQNGLMRLVNEYKTYSQDSTVSYIRKSVELAIQNGEPDLAIPALLAQARRYAMSGAYEQSLGLLEGLDPKKMSREQQLAYYDAYRATYFILGFYTSMGQVKAEYENLAARYIDSLKSVVDKGSDRYLKMEEKRFREAGLLDSCEMISDLRLSMAQHGTPAYSSIAFRRAMLYRKKGMRNRYEEYLALSAMSDIKASIKDYASLTQLAWELHEDGDVDRAYRYIMVALEDAKFFNSKLRFVNVSKVLPVVTASYEAKLSEQSSAMQSNLIIGIVLTCGILVILAFLIVRKRQLRAVKNSLEQTNVELNDVNMQLDGQVMSLQRTMEQLVESDRVKEHYLANYLDLYSELIYQLESYQVSVKKLAEADEFDAIKQRYTSDNLVQEQMEMLNQHFDAAFLAIYPEFVANMNELLTPQEQMSLTEENTLSPELRIFALIKLGVRDSAQIAKLLRYTTNTVSNYRAKVKNGAKIPREEFEDRVVGF